MHNDTYTQPTMHLTDPPRPSRRRWPRLSPHHWWIAGVIGVTVAIVGINYGTTHFGDEKPRDGALGLVAEACGAVGPGVSVGDGGRSLNIVGAGRFDGPKIEDVACVLAGTGIPDSVVSRIDSTRALDGMQEASWDGYHAFWTYHPDDGLWMVIEQE
jgi:hypothetical protein